MSTKKITFAIAITIACILLVSPLAAQEEEGYLRVKINPWDAGVYVDGKYVGTAAMYGHKSKTLPLPVGKHEVKFVDPRHEDLIIPLQIDKGKTSTVRMSMVPKTIKYKGPYGELETSGFGNAAVYLNGAYYANTRELQTAGHTLLLQPGTYTMKIVPVGGAAPREEKVTINADEVLVISKTGAPTRRK
jgi:PEGA domain-containing protein